LSRRSPDESGTQTTVRDQASLKLRLEDMVPACPPLFLEGQLMLKTRLQGIRQLAEKLELRRKTKNPTRVY